MNKKHQKSIQPNELSEKTKTSLRIRIISAVVGLLILIPCVLIGDWAFFAFMSFIAFSGFYEVVKCVKKNYNIWLYIVTIFLAFLISYWPFLRGIVETVNAGENIVLYNLIQAPYLSLILLFVGTMLIFLMAILHKSLTVKDATFIITLVVLVALGVQSALYLRSIPSQINNEPRSYFNVFDNLEASTLIIFSILATFMTDTGAYFVGILFGKHKLNERISPNKTWEGFFGGLFVSFVVSASFALILAACNHPILKGVFDLEHWYHIVVVCLIIPLLGTLGDLIFSAIKRYFEIKDFSNLIPGHGGILDRLDSLIFTMTFIALYVCVVLAIKDGGLEAFI